jgi:hypothetical protein
MKAYASILHSMALTKALAIKGNTKYIIFI